jgi:integrase
MEPRRALFGLTLAWTGARISEVLALTRTSFQLECGVVAFVTLKRRRHCVREVPIPPALMAALDRQFALTQASPAGADQERLWRWRRETGWRIIKKAMIAAKVEGRCACPKGLRHGLGVGALQAGVPLNLVQRWLGHARISTTAIYTEAIGPEERAIAARFWASTERAATSDLRAKLR